MASDNETLWLVSKRKKAIFIIPRAEATWVFRTREAARKFAKDKNARSYLFKYAVAATKWGVEQ